MGGSTNRKNTVGKKDLEKFLLNPLRSVDLVPENNLVWNFMEDFVAESLESLNGEILSTQDEILTEDGEILPEGPINTYLPQLFFNYSIYPLEFEKFTDAVRFCYNDLIFRMGKSSGLAIVIRNNTANENEAEEKIRPAANRRNFQKFFKDWVQRFVLSQFTIRKAWRNTVEIEK